MWSRPCIAVVLMAGLAVAIAAGAESVGDRLQKGIYQEETVGDLDAAMKIYQGIVADEKANRPHVAQAKYRLGICHVKKGDKEKAVATFEELVKEFPGQAKLLEQARGQLAALGHAPESEAAAEVELQEVWSFPGLDDLNVLAISRDGRYCAFTCPRTAGLVVRDLSIGEDRRAAETAVDSFISEASISPDNKWVAYAEHTDKEWSELRIVGIDGSQQRVLYPNEEKSVIGDLQWSPDSQHVLTTFFDTGDEHVDVDEATARIATVAIADGSTRVLKVLAPEEHDYYPGPQFSLDGRYVCFARMMDRASGQEDIVLIPLAGGPEIPLVESPADDWQLGWLPDGKSLLFQSDRRGGSDDAWMIGVVDGKPMGLPRFVKKGIPWNLRGPVRTPTGGWAFYYRETATTRYASSARIATLDPETGGLSTPLELIAAPTAGRERVLCPDFSHDGKYLAYYVSPENQPTHGQGMRSPPGSIVIRSLETGQEREITPTPKFSDRGWWPVLRWHPDGRSILAVGAIETGQSGLFRIDIDTGKIDPLAFDGPETQMPDWRLGRWREGEYVWLGEWSADGKTLYYKRFTQARSEPKGWKTTEHRVLTRDESTGQEKELCRMPGGLFGDVKHAVSPDGQHVLLASTTASTLTIVPSDGGEARQLLDLEKEPSERIFSVTWMPDGRHVLYVKSGPEGPELWRIAAQGGEPERVDRFPAGTIVKQLRIHPDGRRIAFNLFRRVVMKPLRMMQVKVSDELAKEMCTENLRRIGKAIEQYKKDHGDVPNWLSDLVPDYLPDASLLLCPADETNRTAFYGPDDPKTPCSYLYTFNPETFKGLTRLMPVAIPEEERIRTWKTIKQLHMKYYGGVVPIVSCAHQEPTLALSYDGEIYEVQRGWKATPKAVDSLMRRLKEAMDSSPETWADHYDTFKLAAILAASDRLPELTDLLEKHIEEHPGEESTAAQGLLAALPNMHFVSRSEDDAEESLQGEMVLDSSDLDMQHFPEGLEAEVVGMRFANIRVPNGSRIKKAYVQFTAQSAASEKTDLTIQAELSANAETFTDTEHNISSRKRTKASVKWSPEPWNATFERSEKQRTPDLSSLIEEVVAQPGWQEGNSLVLIITGSGNRDAVSFDGRRNRGGPPMLYVEH